MQFQNKTLKCTECGADFNFSAGEQQFFSERNLQNLPKRCANCRLALRLQRAGRDVSVLSDVTCFDCQRPTKVPFKPRGHRPIFCNDCMATRKSVAATDIRTAAVKQPELVEAG